MFYESLRYEADRSTRDGERARDRRAAQHVRELEIGREPAVRAENGHVERSIRWIARAAHAAASWMA